MCERQKVLKNYCINVTPHCKLPSVHRERKKQDKGALNGKTSLFCRVMSKTYLLAHVQQLFCKASIQYDNLTTSADFAHMHATSSARGVPCKALSNWATDGTNDSCPMEIMSRATISTSGAGEGDTLVTLGSAKSQNGGFQTWHKPIASQLGTFSKELLCCHHPQMNPPDKDHILLQINVNLSCQTNFVPL